jgi:hypothetical protein
MAALLLFVLAVAGGVVVADLVWENPAAGQVTVFDHTVSGYPEGWLLVIAAGLGCVVALLLVASVNSTKGRRARRKQLGRLRRGLEHQVVAPKPDHGRLLDEFFGPEEPPATSAGRPTSRPKGESAQRMTSCAGSRPNRSSTPPSRSTSRRARPTSGKNAGRAERKMVSAGSQANGSRTPPSRCTSRPGAPLACPVTGTSRSRPARGGGGSGARRCWWRQGAATTRWSHAARGASSARLS